MATRISSFRGLILLSFFAYLCLCAHEAEETTETQHLHQFSHTIPVISLIPSNTCTSSTKGSERKSSLEVIHKYGPCFQSKSYDEKVPSDLGILLQDQARVNSIHSRFSKEYSDNNKSRDSQLVSTLPANSGVTIGSGNYIVTVGLGTPKSDLKLVFDTGSDLTWTQCKPCAGSCYSQVDPIFDPSKSTSYSKTACTSPVCFQLTSATGNLPLCSSTLDCVYRIRYGDGSFSVGDFSKDRLTITPADVLDSFLFGCGQNNGGLFRGIAGLLGLGRNQISIVKQAAQKYGRFFSYCLPSTSSSTGHLTFGNGGVSSSVKFTALKTLSQSQSFYGLDLIGLSVNGHQLSIPTSTFSAGTIIDSGTVITRLPPTAYSALRTAFREAMRGCPMTTSSSTLFDTCYDLSKSQNVKVPIVSFLFGGGLRVDLEPVGVLYVLGQSEVCLAFAGNSDASGIGIIGNTQQRKLEVVYDVAGGRIGFGPGGCR